MYCNFRSSEKALGELVILIHICKLALLYNVLHVLNVFRFDDSGTYCCRLHNGKGDTQVHFSRESVVVVKSRPLKKAGYEEGTKYFVYKNSTVGLGFFYPFFSILKLHV